MNFSVSAEQYWGNKSNCSGLTKFSKLASENLEIRSNGSISFPSNEYGIMFFGKLYSKGVIRLKNDGVGELYGKIKNNKLELRFTESGNKNLFYKLSRCKFIFTKVESNKTKKVVKKTTSTSSLIDSGTQEDLIVNVGDRVFFSYDSAELDADAQELLQSQAAWLKQYNKSVIIEGHSDERVTFDYALGLGLKRAAAVKNFLLSLGIPDRRISIISYGRERPAVTGSNDAAWSQNRRAVTTIR